MRESQQCNDINNHLFAVLGAKKKRGCSTSWPIFRAYYGKAKLAEYIVKRPFFATFVLLVPPTINKFTVGEHLRLGQRVSMLCSVTDGDLPLTLKWYRHDQLLLPEAQAAGGISVTDIGQYESVLRIDNLRPEHNANFTCVAENYAGISQHSQVLRVKGTKN